MMNKRNPKKGSALITTVMVALLVCALVGIMLSLSMYDKTLAKNSELAVTRQNQLDMLTDLFLKYGNVPAENFGYTINVYHFENGNSTMTVRTSPTELICTMVVEQRDGDLIARYYNTTYEHTETTCDRTIGIHNESDTKPYLKLSIPKSAVSSNGPFYVYGRIKLERAMATSSSGIDAFVNLAGDGKSERTVIRLTDNTNGWVELHDADGKPLKFEKVPSSSLDFIFGLNKTTGDLTISDLVIVNSKNQVCYSLANDRYMTGIGNVRSIQGSSHWWRCYGGNAKTTTYPIVTRDPDNYVPQRMISVVQNNNDNAGESCVALYKSAICDKGGEGWYYITGRIRVTVNGMTKLCDVAGEWPTGMIVDVSGAYDHDNDDSTPDVGPYVSSDKLQPTMFYYRSGCWSPILDQSGNYYKFYASSNCERSGEDYLKFTLWACKGTFDIADIRVYKLSSKTATPNPASDTCVYNMETDTKLTDSTRPNCKLGGDTVINDFWSIHWLPHERYLDQGLITTAGSWQVQIVVNPNTVSHNKAKDYDLPEFSNKVGTTYVPK